MLLAALNAARLPTITKKSAPVNGYKFFDTKLNHENKLFNKIANIVQNSQDKFDFNPEDIWKALKIAKTSGYFQLESIYPQTVKREAFRKYLQKTYGIFHMLVDPTFFTPLE